MSAAVVEKPTDIIICDICGKEITAEELNDVEAVGHLVGEHPGDRPPRGESDGDDGDPPSTFTVEMPKHKIISFAWPSVSLKLARRKEIAEEQGEGESPTWRHDDPIYARHRNYDFHAKCVANLLDAAVEYREAQEAKTRKAEETVARRNAKIIADAERKRAQR